MSTTVTYKGSTLTTVDNQTRTLKTAGKYMEGDVILTDVTEGGNGGYVWQDAQGYVHLDDEGTTPITVEPLSVTQNGTYTATTGHAYSPVIVNVSGSGLVYETGTWTPSEDVAEAWIPFVNTHTEAPFCYSIIATEYTDSDSSNGGTDYINYAQIIGEPFRIGTSTSSVRYGAARKLIRSGASIQANITYPHTNTGDSTTSYSRYWAKETGIRAAQYSSGYYWRAGITYKWAAVWAPTT